MKYKREPWGHQLEVIERAAPLPEFGLFFEVGCVSCTAQVRVNRGGASKTISIETLFRQFHGVDGFDKSTNKTYIRGLKSDNKTIGLNKVIDVVRSGEKPVYAIKTTGRYTTLKATKDHKVFTKRGWVCIGDLAPSDQIAFDVLKRHQKKSKKVKPKKENYRIIKVGPFYKYGFNEVVYNNKINRKEAYHRLVAAAFKTGIPTDEYIQKTYSAKYSQKLVMLDPKKIHIHHKDKNTKNNSLDNLEILSVEDHLKLHGEYSYFGHGSISWRQFKSLEFLGNHMTYDICCENPHNSFVADNVVVHNSGKTLTAINILRHKYDQHRQLLKTLVFGPPIVLENWRREFSINSDISKKNIHVLSGHNKDRIALFNKHKDDPNGAIFITNYEALLMKDLYALLLEWKPEVLVWDELHKLKDPTSKRTKLAIPLADVSKYRLGLTGTPILNSLMDVFSQFRVLDQGRTFGKNFFSFRSRFFYDKNAGAPANKYFPDWRPRPKIETEFHNMIASISKTVKKEDCMTLPPLVKQRLYSPMGKEQNRMYTEMKKQLVTYLGDKAAVANLAITKALRLQQIVSGFVKLDDGTIHRFKENPREDQLHDLLEELAPHHKIIVWAVFHENYVTIRGICDELKIKYVEVTGEVSASLKQENVDAFNTDDSVRVFIGHPLSAGIGINLVISDITIFYSRNFSLEQDIQAEGRFYRGGSEVHKKVLRYDLVTEDTIDENVIESLYNKQALSDSVLLNILKKEEHETNL